MRGNKILAGSACTIQAWCFVLFVFLSVCIHAIHMDRKSNAGFEEMHTMMALYRRLGCISLLCVRCAVLAVSIRVGCVSHRAHRVYIIFYRYKTFPSLFSKSHLLFLYVK